MTADLKELDKRMQGAMDALKKELAGLRTGRASVALLDPVMVEAYGQRMPLNQVGTVSAPEPRLLTVNVWDKGLVISTAKAIREAGLGLNPAPDGQTIRVPIRNSPRAAARAAKPPTSTRARSRRRVRRWHGSAEKAEKDHRSRKTASPKSDGSRSHRPVRPAGRRSARSPKKIKTV
jgi:ribosome recycling factor